MITKTFAGIGRSLTALCVVIAGLGASTAVYADDTEIYRASYQPGASGRPKVLILFDESGSMDAIVEEAGRPAYDPDATYVSSFDSDRIYWSTGDTPPSASSNQWFSASKNRCDQSYTPLADTGKYSSRARRWREADGEWVTRRWRQWQRINGGWQRVWVEEEVWDGDAAGWVALSSTDQSPVHMDCYEDYRESNDGNGPGQSDGYPDNPDTPGAANSEAYIADRDSADLSWGNSAYAFYTAHYMDYWYDATILTEEKDRLQIAQEVVESLVTANTAIDFGLAAFNRNDDSSADGGRIVQRIIQGMTQAQRDDLVDMVWDFDHSGWTPLCESTYEVYRYLAGLGVQFGLERDTTADAPARDMLAERTVDGDQVYISPNSDCAYTYIIIMTDGEPTRDTAANTAIETLTGKTCSTYSGAKNCLPEIAEYMATTDMDGDASNGNQYGKTFTIGFNTDQTLLSDTATKGKGVYYTTDTAEGLAAAFQGAVLAILSTDSTFTSPAVAVDTFTRTQSRDDVFFAMFKPSDTEDWPGNIKKLNLAISNGNAILVDKNGDAAMDPGTGLIADYATTVWSTEDQDGPHVEKGGVGALLAASDLTTRANRVVTNTGNGGALQKFNSTNVDASAYGFDVVDPNEPVDPNAPSADEQLFSFWEVSDQTELNEVIRWAIGYDLNDEDEDDDTTDNRPWILADILHSKPLVVNYGALGSFTADDPDMRIVVGTNAGFMHMFGNDDGQEDWAFFAKELGPVLTRRKESFFSSGHVYGVDSPAVVYTNDVNGDGTLDHSDGDQVWLFFGLRRGGHLMYGLDISNPDSPSFMWKIGPSRPGYEELGQTWSIPVVSYVPGHFDSNTGKPKPVLIFGAGYDTNKDDHNNLAVGGPSDSVGRGMYIVDAETGALVWSVTPAVNSAKNMQATELLHSIAAPVSILDSNGDELVDRVYLADTGGNVWRVDLAGNTLPGSSQDTWFLTHLFRSNDGTTATDRRFFSSLDIVRTTVEGKSVDAVMLGSGDRTNPAELDDPDDANNPSVDNEFYMVKDEKVWPYFEALDQDECDNDPTYDFRCQLPLDPNDLYDATDNLIQVGTDAEKAAAEAALVAAKGWRLSLTANGEKSLARSLTVAGNVYFTTFSPDAVTTNLCEPVPGTGRLYIVDLFDAREVRDFDPDEGNGYERSWIIGGLIPDTPSAHFGSDGEIRLLLPPGGGADGPAGNPFETGAELPEPYGSYWYREEQ